MDAHILYTHTFIDMCMSIHMDAYILYTHTHTHICIWLRQMTLSRDHMGFQQQRQHSDHTAKSLVLAPKMFIPLTAPLTVAASTT